MTTNLMKLALLPALLGLAAWTSARVADTAASHNTCVCKCQWAKDVGPMLPGTYTFVVQDQSCPAIVVGNDVPCRDENNQMHVSGRHYDCQFVPAGAPLTSL